MVQMKQWWAKVSGKGGHRALFAGSFMVLGIALLLITQAATPTKSFEAEDTPHHNATVLSDAQASGQSYLQFGRGTVISPTPPPTAGGPALPAPISPAGRDFGTILRDYPQGGVVVLPDGDYKVSDVSNFRPSQYLIVVAQHPGKARVIRAANALGATDQLFSGSGKLIFVGIRFHEIATQIIGNSSDIHYWYTQHSNPVLAHPTPNQTVCTPGQGPVGFEIKGASNISLYGLDAIDFGHDGVKINNLTNFTVKGTVIDQLSHHNLQQGRGNASCGWDGNDNYHTDSIQSYPGNIMQMTVEDSFVGQRFMIQEEAGGSGSKNIVIKNVSVYEGAERVNNSCIAIDTRVKANAAPGATLQLFVSGTEIYCHNTSEWTLHVGGSRDNALSINGTPIRSTEKDVGARYLTRIVGKPAVPTAKVMAWRAAHPYNTWHCFFDALLPNFNNTFGSCGG